MRNLITEIKEIGLVNIAFYGILIAMPVTALASAIIMKI